MKSLFTRRNAVRDVTNQQLALPPGFRKIFLSQSVEMSVQKRAQGGSGLNAPIQDNDPTSPTFGEFFFMVGYD